jgi:hypothetical protein
MIAQSLARGGTEGGDQGSRTERSEGVSPFVRRRGRERMRVGPGPPADDIDLAPRQLDLFSTVTGFAVHGIAFAARPLGAGER